MEKRDRIRENPENELNGTDVNNGPAVNKNEHIRCGFTMSVFPWLHYQYYNSAPKERFDMVMQKFIARKTYAS